MPVSAVPVISERPATDYVAIGTRVGRDSLGEVVPGLLGEVGAWLGAAGVAHQGEPIVRYLVVDYATGEVQVDVGVTVEMPASVDGCRVHAGLLPAGRWATVRHLGGYGSLVDSTAGLLAWGREQGIAWAGEVGGEVTSWLGRVEQYLVGPPVETDPAKWETEIAILLADSATSSCA